LDDFGDGFTKVEQAYGLQAVNLAGFMRRA
jgi:hypothetical protein